MNGAPHVVVIGGGYAGIAAALDVAQAGMRVTLLEARRLWGGRATSWPDPKTKDPVDNGQHVWMGAYRETRALLGRLGKPDAVAFDRGLDLAFCLPGGRRHRLRAPAWPGRTGLAFALARFGAIPLAERAALAGALERGAPPEPSWTVRVWLDALEQGPTARAVFWHPLTEATINLPPDEAAASLLHAVVVRAFRGAAADAAIGVARAGLGEILAGVPDVLARHGGRALLASPVRGVSRGDERGLAVELEAEERIAADAVILAVPAVEAHDLVAETLPAAAATLEPARATPSSPIVTLTLWFDTSPLSAPITGLVATPDTPSAFHFAFDRGRHVGGRPGAWPVVLVASAARDLVGLPANEIAARGLAALRERGIHAPEPVATRVVKEPRATPAFTPETQPVRPPNASGVDGVVFAGDWTKSELPATIETAVTSGRAAARLLLDSAILRASADPRP